MDASRTLRLETEAIVVGYAMSRLDQHYLKALKFKSWQDAFKKAGSALSVKPTSFKNLRDEFDPVHSNSRQGWHQRALRQNRQRVLDELKDISDEALIELVTRILVRDQDATVEAIDSLAVKNRISHNVAERLLTGRRAEDYFLEHSFEIVRLRRDDLIDQRLAACGYDFGVKTDSKIAIEIKGIKTDIGQVQFTDKEWTEAQARRNNYLLVVIGNLTSTPIHRLYRNPHDELDVRCRFQKTIAAIWHSSVRLRT